VSDFLAEAIAGYETDLIRPLNIKPLISKKLNQLSGGELQRVSIAFALGKECDAVLLDEPSAYLDVEQRLATAKIINNIAETKEISIMVVDHDLLFLDYLSQRLIVFKGVPAKSGSVHGPFVMEEGMNHLLRDIDITLRRETRTGRPRINKLDSQKDQEQKKSGKYYYA